MQFSLKKKLHPVMIPIALLLITGAIIISCHIITPTDNADYHASLLEKIEYARTFSDFTNALFCYEATTDSITTAYTLKNPADYDIPVLPAKLTSFTYHQYNKDKIEKKNENC